MRDVIRGFAGWARMQETENERVQLVDTAITVTGTLVVALAWALVQH